MLPNGVNIPMPRPYGGTPPIITRVPKSDGTEGELITVQFVGEIGPITQYTEMIDVLDNAKETDEIRIVIDSPGGDVYTTQQLVGRMESCKATVTTVASGLVASAATFLWFYGKNKEVRRWARFMHHSSLHGDWGKSLAIQENATELVNYMKSILTAEMKAGILLAEEVRKIIVDKADVEISGSVVKARLQKVAAEDGAAAPAEGGEELPPEVTPTEGEPETTPAPETTPTEGQPEVTPAPTEGGEEVPPAEGGDDETVLDLARIFAEELGIEQEPVQTPDNQPTQGGEETTTEETPEPVTTTAPEAKCKGACKGGKCATPAKKAVPAKKVAPVKKGAKAEDEELPAEAVPAEGQPAEVQPEAQPGEGDGDTGAETGDIPPVEGGEAPAAKCGKKGKKKAKIAALFAQLGKILAEDDTADSDVTVGDEPESVKPDQNKNVPDMGGDGEGVMKEGGQTGKENNPAKETPIFDIAKIFAEELGTEETQPVEVPAGAPEVTPGEGEGQAEQTAAPAAELPGEGTGEGDPAKTDPGTTVVAPEKEADKNSNVEVAPAARASRYW